VFATQNPIELEGTYPLPEAQLDRFLFEVVLEYLPEEDEVRVARETTGIWGGRLERIITGAELVAYQRLVRQVPAADPVVRYAVMLTRMSRPVTAGAPDFIRKWVAYGASVRSAQALLLGGKARALLAGRAHVSYEDVRSLAAPVLRHRLLLNFQAQSERVTTDQVIDQLLAAVPTPRSGM
jgi:MoxR-like ATPase